MLVDKLRMTVAAQQHTEVIKPGDNTLQLHTINQKYGDWRFGFANGIKENVLKILIFV